VALVVVQLEGLGQAGQEQQTKATLEATLLIVASWLLRVVALVLWVAIPLQAPQEQVE
jgi:hypothetical protein